MLNKTLKQLQTLFQAITIFMVFASGKICKFENRFSQLSKMITSIVCQSL